MLAVVTAPGARLDAGSVALALARRWSDAGESVVFVDADPSGARLAERLREAEHAEYSPAVRGLPSLIVAREPLAVGSLADHCYSLDTAAGSLWALFAPHHPAGAELAALWLGDRAEGLAAVDAHRSVVVSSSLPAGAEALAPVLWASAVLAVVAPVETAEAARRLSQFCRDLRLSDLRCRHRVVIVEGESSVSDDDIRVEAGMHVVGRLQVVDDNRVLRAQGGRRERAFAAKIDDIAARLLAVSRSAVARSTTVEAAERLPAALEHGFGLPPVHSGVNGADATLPSQADGVAEVVGEEVVREGRG